MKEIWTKDEAVYHGQYVNFDPIWSWPKPVQKPHPPVIMGGDGPKALEGLLDYCEEWMPHPDRTDQPLAGRIADVNRRAAEAGRGPIPVTAFGGPAEAQAIADCQAAGAEGYIVRFPSAQSDEILPLIEQYAEVARSFR
jgi:alkanesulfonate monooxygenase SsuD/methylene tetrahydromethanopterin reductase-like flavin-dependent oxidoreductase (luciferase family)